MMKITGCKIFNQFDSKHYTLYAEWFDTYFKVILFQPTLQPLSGKMSSDDINYFCNELSKTRDEYLQETRDILCGKNSDIQFSVNDKALQWRRNMWTLGRIELCSILNIQIICESFQELLMFYQDAQEKLNTLEEENKCLTSINTKLNLKLEKMINIKTTMEQDLYKKFVIILNSKKKKIQELADIIKDKQNVKESVFNVPTDESEASDCEDEAAKTKCEVVNKSNKRKSDVNSSPKSVQKSRKTKGNIENKTTPTALSCANSRKGTEFTVVHNEQAQNKKEDEEQSSTSKTRKSRSSLNFIAEESEEELFSQ